MDLITLSCPVCEKKHLVAQGDLETIVCSQCDYTILIEKANEKIQRGVVIQQDAGKDTKDAMFGCAIIIAFVLLVIGLFSFVSNNSGGGVERDERGRMICNMPRCSRSVTKFNLNGYCEPCYEDFKRR
jgi:hypothetical protein